MDNFSNAAKLKVVGVGGAGGNAINDMIESNITTVDFIAINTDQQDLDRSKAPIKVLLGKGMGAGADPEKGRIAAKESEEKIKEDPYYKNNLIETVITEFTPALFDTDLKKLQEK